MNRERFIQSRRDDWQHFEQLLSRLQSVRQSGWSSRDIASLAKLYRSICYDLSLVQSREWGNRLEQYLNDLVAQGHSCLYRSPPQSVAAIWKFLATDFPQLFRRRRSEFLLALGLFLIPLLVSAWLGCYRPDIAALVTSRQDLDQAIEMYSGAMYEEVDAEYAAQRSFMTGFYIHNNTGIAFRAYALGVLAGIGTCYVLLSNGIGIGVVLGTIAGEGTKTAENFFSFVISHGSFELTAIVISGAAGFVLARGLMMPGDRSRLDAAKFHGKESLQLALGAGAMLFVAALLEGYFSPLPIPAWQKYVAGSGLWLLVVSYLCFAGRERASR